MTDGVALQWDHGGVAKENRKGRVVELRRELGGRNRCYLAGFQAMKKATSSNSE